MAQARIARGDQVVEVDGITPAAARELLLLAASYLDGKPGPAGAAANAITFGFGPTLAEPAAAQEVEA